MSLSTEQIFKPTQIIKVKKNSYIKTFERFNQHALNYILENKNNFIIKEDKLTNARMEYLKACFGKSYDPYLMISKYLAMSTNGIIPVKYIQRNNEGRFQAIAGLSMQGMPIEFRHTIARDIYKDIDIKNCHFVILLKQCVNRGLNTPFLKAYVDERDITLELLSAVPKDVAKIMLLAVMNGGTKDYTEYIAEHDRQNIAHTEDLDYLINFKSEMDYIHNEFAKDKAYKKFKKDRESKGLQFNPKACYVNKILRKVENDILLVMWDYFSNPEDAVLVFDGLQVNKNCKIELKAIETKILDLLKINVELVVKEMNKGFKIPDKIPKYIEPNGEIPNCFDFDDSYNYMDFHNEFNGAMFDSFNELDKTISSKCNSVIVKILDNEGSYCKKGKDGEINAVRSLGISGFDMSLLADDGKYQTYTLFMYLKQKNGFNTHECKLINGCKNNFNLWSGFAAVETKTTTEGFTAMKDFIFKTWASSNEIYYNYIISWLAGLVQTSNLDKINGVALVMISQQGTGKGFLIRFLRLILRNCNVIEMTGVSSLVQKHNTAIQNKRLFVVNEMSSTREEFKSNFDKVKPFITDPYLKVEPKGMKAYVIDNVGNGIFFTNHEDSVIIEDGGRRFNVFKVAPVFKDNHAFFADLEKKAFNQETANAFYTYLMNFKCVNVKKILDTQIRRDIMQLSKPSALKFIDSLNEEIPDIRPHSVIIDSDSDDDADEKQCEKLIITPAALYTRFVRWCGDNGERAVSSTKFGLILKNYIEKGIIVKKRTSKGRFYHIKPQ